MRKIAAIFFVCLSIWTSIATGVSGKVGSQDYCTSDQSGELERLREELESMRTQLNDAQKLNVKILQQKTELERELSRSKLEVKEDGEDSLSRATVAPTGSLPSRGTPARRTPPSDSGHSMSDIAHQAEHLHEKEVAKHRRELERLISDIKSSRSILPTEDDEGKGIYIDMSASRTDGLQLPTREEYLEVLQGINASDILVEAWYEHITLQRDDPPVPQGAFPRGMFCDIKYRSDKKPTSVHRLRPGDVDVIAAMGDSITAGFGADASWYFLHQYLTEYRGVSWSVGGDDSFAEGTTTLPNILKEFNPNLKGFSIGTIKFWQDPLESENTRMNVAITGNVASDLEDQAERLVRKLKDDRSINFDRDWKMVTIFIGANNLCRYCNDPDEHSASSAKRHIERALDILYNRVPRVFVNLVEIFDIAPVTELATFEFGKLICTTLVKVANACPCSRVNNPDTKLMTRMSKEYQKIVADVAASNKYKAREDFTIVNQPFFRKIVPPKDANGEPDMTFFAQDCFHFSVKGQKRAGKALWNSIIEPVGKKRDTWDLREPVKCPVMEYLPTNKNSVNN